MDPTTALVGLLAAGASASAKEVAGQAVKDIYIGLKAAISRYLTKPEAIDQLEEDPLAEEVQAEAVEMLGNSAAMSDDEVRTLAEQLATALAELDDSAREKAGISIGAITAAKSAILRDFSAEGSISIESVTANDGDAVITGLTAGNVSGKK